MGKTSIEWTDASWNPIVGCTEISPGCANCYAARLAATRLRNTPQYKGLATYGNQFVNREPGIVHTLARTAPRWTGQVRFLPERLKEPLRWKTPRRIFVCDMGDLFHEEVLDSTIVQVFATMLATPHHTYQILTKRADRMNGFLSQVLPELWEIPVLPVTSTLPLSNVWLGVSVENQHFADERIPLLLQTPAAVRWISAEPLLGPITGIGTRDFGGIDWVVCGGESGPNARPMHPDWVRSLRNQCQAAGVPFFFKQWGEWLPPDQQARNDVPRDGKFVRFGKKEAGRLLDGREWSEFPR